MSNRGKVNHGGERFGLKALALKSRARKKLGNEGQGGGTEIITTTKKERESSKHGTECAYAT